jgi:hypothetical protein
MVVRVRLHSCLLEEQCYEVEEREAMMVRGGGEFGIASLVSQSYTMNDPCWVTYLLFWTILVTKLQQLL